MEEYKNNTVSQISGKISRMYKQPKSDVLSAIREHWVQGLLVSAATNRLLTKTGR